MFFSQEKRAAGVRGRIIKDGKYLLARIEGSGQERNVENVVNDFFRYKHYNKDRKWLSASVEDVWSGRFLGVAKDVKSVPLSEIKRIRYQNPCYSAALRLGGDPRDYNKIFTIQVAGCDFDCNYCYVPNQINVANPKFGGYFSAKEMIDIFVKERNGSKEKMNVVRISGGNPTIVPEIMTDVFGEMEDRGLKAYLWVDTNLSTDKYVKGLRGLKKVLKSRNVGVVGCFKGTCKEDFSVITGAQPGSYDKQFRTARWFLDQGTDFYVYLPALVYEKGVEGKLEGFMKRLRRVHRNLPLRTEMLEIVDYPGAKMNFERAAKLGRPLPTTNQKAVFDIWYNKLLPGMYTSKELDRFCCQVPLK
jgi:uncharacterized Fe-S cluster-containing radical SAM superfamily protein